MAFRDFTQTSVWKKAFKLLMTIYEVTKTFPKEERYGLTSDMRRAANSVLHNIAEGFGRFESRDKTRFYKFSRGSAYELVSQSLVASAQNYISESKKEELLEGYKDVIQELDNLVISIEGR
jgi:four helix bundle protein